MNRAKQPAEDRRGQFPSPSHSLGHPRQRVRKRRYHIPREALGLGLYQEPTTDNKETPDVSVPTKALITQSAIEPKIPAPPSPSEIAEAELRLETERKLRLSRRGIWTCIVVLLLVIFRHAIGWILDQATYAWPSINWF